MTLVISTSSPEVSVAISDGQRILVRSAASERNASQLVVELTESLLKERDCLLSDVSEIVVDIGPGGFTGVKVGVVMAKMWAESLGCRLFGVDSFDLIAVDADVVVPFKKGHGILRRRGEAPILTTDAQPSEVLGYGDLASEQRFPSTIKAPEAVDRWMPSSVDELVPRYFAEPSISTPKQPYASLRTE